MRVLAFSGSLRKESFNTGLVRAATEVAPPGVEIELYDRLGALPHYDADLDVGDGPPAVADLRERIAQADALLFATPEYNGSIPGVLKNAVDWASRPRGNAALWGKPALVIGTSTGAYGGLWAQSELRKVLGIAGARPMEDGLAAPRANESFDAEGRLFDPSARSRLAGLLGELTLAAEPIAA
jgi:chromate reductase, NAD(P)H dehydrogenase (quinone)